jgi:hypothetical protein
MMMRQTWITALAASVLLSGAAFSQQTDVNHGAHHGQPGATQPSHGDHGAHRPMLTGGMDMAAHQEHMTRMRSLMEQARDTDNPEERRRLMDEHREMMQARMSAMMGGGDPGGLMARCAQDMSMMHDMMQQMMARQEMMDGVGQTDR